MEQEWEMHPKRGDLRGGKKWDKILQMPLYNRPLKQENRMQTQVEMA